MKLKYDFKVMDLDEETIAVPLGCNGDNFNGVLKLNASGALLLDLLRQDTTEETIVAQLQKDYDTSVDELTAFVHDFVVKLQEADLIVN